MASTSADASHPRGSESVSPEELKPSPAQNDPESDEAGKLNIEFDDKITAKLPQNKRHKSWDSSERSISMSIWQMSLDQNSHVQESALANIFSNSQNSAIKWQRARGVVGALEVKSEPSFRVQDPLVPRLVKDKEKVFQEAVEVWEDLNLGKEFIGACEKLPRKKWCCGLFKNDDATKRRFVNLLNDGWCKKVNKMLLKDNVGFKIDTFLWNWQNASGKTETNIVLIRFFEMSTYRFKKAGNDGSEDFEIMVEEGNGKDMAEPNVNSVEVVEMARE